MFKISKIVTQAPFGCKASEPMHEWHRWREHPHFGFGELAYVL